MLANPYNRYKQTAVETASPEMLIIMLYDGAIRFIRQAKESTESKQVEQANNYICKAQAIVNELILSLDMNTGEIAFNLRNIYDYWRRRLVEANVKKDATILGEVLQQAEELREAWSEAVMKYRESQPQVVGGVNIEG